jgi:hypothetical protein
MKPEILDLFLKSAPVALSLARPWSISSIRHDWTSSFIEPRSVNITARSSFPTFFISCSAWFSEPSPASWRYTATPKPNSA